LSEQRPPPHPAAQEGATYPTSEFPFPIKIKRSLKAKKLSLTVDARDGSARLVLPRNASQGEGWSFLHRESKWILDELTKLPPRRLFNDGTTFAVLGKRCKVRHLPHLPEEAHLEGRELVIGGYPAPNEQVIKWLKCTAGSSMQKSSFSKAASLNLQPPRISIRDPRGSWGSCSELGSLSFSWRLTLAPPWVMDYVISHEIAHLLEFNHGTKFWCIVAKLCPRHKSAKHWLGNNGPLLLRYG
jgi:predicted metal-dependent hydrolase